MKFDSELVEYIVREVIRRLKADGQFTSSRSAQPEVTARELHLTDRVVTSLGASKDGA